MGCAQQGWGEKGHEHHNCSTCIELRNPTTSDPCPECQGGKCQWKFACDIV